MPSMPMPSSLPISFTCFRWVCTSSQVLWIVSTGAPESSNCPPGSSEMEQAPLRKRDDVAVLLDGLPAEALHGAQQGADAVGALIGQPAQRLAVEGEFFMLGADAPLLDRLAALLDVFDELALAGDGFAARFRWSGHFGTFRTSSSGMRGSAGTIASKPRSALPRVSAPAGAPGRRREWPASRQAPRARRCRREARAAPSRRR